jgi:hypothetical protein
MKVEDIKWEKFQDRLEWAELRLACLKENFQFRRFYERWKNGEIQADYENEPMMQNPYKKAAYKKAGIPLSYKQWSKHPLKTLEAEFGIDTGMWQAKRNARDEKELIDLLNPYGEPPDELRELLPDIFYSYGIRELMTIQQENQTERKALARECHDVTGQIEPPKQHEALLLVNLRKSKKQLMTEFEAFLDLASDELDSSRYRKETLKALEVWKLRRKRKSYFDIAQTLKLTPGAAKQAFYRAYELTQGYKYDPETFQYEKPKMVCCETCPTRENCKDIKDFCPDALYYINQDQKSSTREFLPTDSIPSLT